MAYSWPPWEGVGVGAGSEQPASQPEQDVELCLGWACTRGHVPAGMLPGVRRQDVPEQVGCNAWNKRYKGGEGAAWEKRWQLGTWDKVVQPANTGLEKEGSLLFLEHLPCAGPFPCYMSSFQRGL